MKEHFSNSDEETFALGFELGKELTSNSIVCLFGDLAAGKTTFVKGIALGAGRFPSEQVNSPTFTFLNVYEGTNTIFHFDLYRLMDPEEFLLMGFNEYFDASGICCIEWSERIASLLPQNYIRIEMTHLGENRRKIKIKRAF
jgi:tRNA threonylcarbamoyladenosine biosynthesis protein TsaE